MILFPRDRRPACARRGLTIATLQDKPRTLNIFYRDSGRRTQTPASEEAHHDPHGQVGPEEDGENPYGYETDPQAGCALAQALTAKP